MTLNYTTVLNMAFLALSALFLVRFLRTGGVDMLRMMNRPSRAGAAAVATEPASSDRTYACPKHPEVRQAGSGRCPKCGMDLVIQEEYDEPTQPHSGG